MNGRILLELSNLFFAGTLAGIEIASHYGLVAGGDLLNEKARLLLRRGLILRLRILVPAFFLPAFLTTIVMALLTAPAGQRYCRLAALGGYAVWIFARLVATVRINSATLEWDVDAPPRDWPQKVARAERFHTLSLWAITAAFVCLLAAHLPGGGL